MKSCGAESDLRRGSGKFLPLRDPAYVEFDRSKIVFRVQFVLPAGCQLRPCPPSASYSLNMRSVLFTLCLCFVAPIVCLADRPDAGVPIVHKTIIKEYCIDCHNADEAEGKIDLESLSYDLGTLPVAETWQKVLGALNSGEMPPADSQQMPKQQKADLLEDLSEKLVVARKLLSDSGGRITMRRLNRREYANTIRALLHVDAHVDDLPGDTNSSGFDTAGASLFFSSDQFEQYLAIAKRALDDAIVIGPRPKSKTVRTQSEIVANRSVRSRKNALTKNQQKIDRWKNKGKPAGKSPTEFGFIDEARVQFEQGRIDLNQPYIDYYLDHPSTKTGALMVTSFQGAMLDITTLPKQPGNYTIRIRAGALPESSLEDRFLEFGFRNADNQAGEIDVQGCRYVSGDVESPCVIEVPITVTKNSPKSFAVRQRQSNNRSVAKAKFRAEKAANGIGPIPNVWLDWVEVEGPIHKSWPPASHRSIFFRVDAKKNETYARQILRRFATRAFRDKKPSWSLTTKLVDLYQAGRDRGMSFEDALREPLAVILASPSFLYLYEPTEGSENRALTDMELAVRLSYFLWSAPPDFRLLQVARDGQLTDPKVLQQQTDRLLKDPRASNFISGFAHQWLDMDRLDFFQFNEVKYKRFDDSTRRAARAEIYQTIRYLLDENESIGKLLSSDFVVINDVLASYYGIKGVNGSDFRRVDVPSEVPRGGLMSTAAVLAMGSDGEHTSPVERGAWILRKLLHNPPPPAPPNVPQLNREEDETLSARDLQKAHTEEPQCAQCHRKIDPLGFGLENFDAAGAWRDTVITELSRKERKSRKKNGQSRRATVNEIDAAGSMPDGSEFSDFFEMRSEIAKHQDDFARGMTEALIEYALGRAYSFSDSGLAESILSKTKQNDYRLREFIHQIVQSKPFQTK